jgi:branched-chain amino acid transport system permease protein
MQDIILFVLLGLGPGALIAGIALAVVLTYRGSGIINLATGGIAMIAGYAYWSLKTGEFGTELDTAPALVATLLVTVAAGVLIELVAFRPLRNAAPLAKLVSSLGVLLIAQASMLLAFGTGQKPQPAILPRDTVEVLGSNVPVDRFILAGTVVGIAIVLAVLYRFTRFGLATRAAAENELSALLRGLSVNELSMMNTLFACVVAGAIGVLAASVTQLDAISLPLQVVPALAAALLARLTSLAIACAAGLGIGIMWSLLDYFSTKSWFPTDQGVPLPGVKELLAFLIIIAAMFLRGAALPGRGELIEQRLPWVPRPQRLLRPAVTATAVGAVALVVLPFDFRQALINSLIGTVMALSLVVITGFVGQISVVQLALAGVAAFTVSHLAVDFGIGFPLAPLAGVAAAMLLGELTAVSALRVRGVSLAVVTLGAALAIAQFGFVNSTWGGGGTGSPVDEPALFGFDLGPRAGFRGLDGDLPSPVFGWVVLAVTVALCLMVAAVRRSDLGQRMLAVRSNERAAAAAAVDVRQVKLTAFGISSFVAGVAGTLYAYNFGSVSANRFDAITALGLIAFAYAGGITLVSGAVFAGLLSARGLVPHALDEWFGISGNWLLLVGGVLLLLTLIQHPEGVAGTFYRQLHKRAAEDPRAVRARRFAAPDDRSESEVAPMSPAGKS